MKIQAFMFVAALLLFTAFVQDGEGAIGFMPPGRREVQRKVCIPGIIVCIPGIIGNFRKYHTFKTILLKVQITHLKVVLVIR